MSQQELADRAGTSQSAIARIESGTTSPTVDTLERIARAAGFKLRIDLEPLAAPDPMVEAYKKDVDRTLIRENLRKSIDERLTSLAELMEFGRELERAVLAKTKKGKR